MPDRWQRGTAISGIVSVFLVGIGLILTNNANLKQFRLQQDSTRQQHALALQQQDLALKGQRAERFIKAVDQVGQEGNSQLGLRLGGIYALETLMRDSPEVENTIIEVLCAFIRTHAPRPKIIPDDVPQSAADVRSALTVLGRRPEPGGHTDLDLSNTLLGLDGMDLHDANLTGASLDDADLNGANLANADLTDAHLRGANLHEANLAGADLTGAVLTFGYLRGADLHGADLLQADLTDVGLTSGDLRRANLSQANLTGADLTGADLYAADLTSANLSRVNLTGVDVSCTVMVHSVNVPPGVARTPSAALESPRCQE